MNNQSPAPRRSLFERLKTSLEEGIQFARGRLTLRTAVAPSRPPVMGAADVLRLRRRCKLSQGLFARVLNVSTKTVQSWEQGQRTPSQAALRLLQILAENPEVVCRAAGVGPSAPDAGTEPPTRPTTNRRRQKRRGAAPRA